MANRAVPWHDRNAIPIVGALVYGASSAFSAPKGSTIVHIRKAIITAAGRGARLYPAADTVQKAMLPIVDRDGLTKPVIQIIAEEALQSGIEELCIVCAPGDEARFREQFAGLRENLRNPEAKARLAETGADRIDDLLGRLCFAVQEEPLGYGHSLQCARDFAGQDAFLLLLGDHLYVAHEGEEPCAKQLIDLAVKEGVSVSAVNATREHLVGNYGTLTGERAASGEGTYRITRIIEKPSLSQAELELQTPGLRAAHYLCFFGMHVLRPTIFDLLEEAAREARELPLTPSLNELARRETYLALQVRGSRYDIGAPLGLLRTQIALGVSGTNREELLSTIAETLAEARLSLGTTRQTSEA